MKRAALFLDRDGVINVDLAYVYRPEEFDFIPGIFDLVRMAHEREYLVVIVTNQAGIGRGYYTEEDFHLLMNWVKEQFFRQGGHIDGVYFCPCHPEHGVGVYRKESEFRKPAPGMFLAAASELGIDLISSVMIGDKLSDMQAALAAGVGTCLYLGADSAEAGVPIASLHEALAFLSREPAHISRDNALTVKPNNKS